MGWESGRVARALGTPTRGTTGAQRLRRVDRWLIGTQAALLRTAADPLVVDLGFGATPVTTVELWHRLRAVRPDVEVVGVELDPVRVAAAQVTARPGLTFIRGGFEIPLSGRRPMVVRALNVLRQYDEADVPAAWAALCARLAPGGLLVEGTCDELGRRGCWLAVGSDRLPQELVLSAHLAGAGAGAEPWRPSTLAERLPKALIHHNVPGQPIHALLQAWDRAHDRAAPWSAYGPRVRAVEAGRLLRAQGWPLTSGPRRWRLGELAVTWAAVAPGPVRAAE